jgi:hypothetical protein
MNDSRNSLRRRTRGSGRQQNGRVRMPATDPWVGSDDGRLWCCGDERLLAWQAPDPWMHRIRLG